MISCFTVRRRIRNRKTVLILSCVVLFIVYCFTYFKTSDDTSIDTYNYPIILWWTPFIAENIKIISCENAHYKCLVTKNRTYNYYPNLAAYSFYGSNFNFTDLPLPRNAIPWVIFHEESPKNLPFFIYKNGQNLFDITATFSRYSDFPLPLQFIQDLSLIYDKTFYVPLNKKNELLDRNAPVLYVQSDCDTPIERDHIVKELMQYVKVDSYGSCLNNKVLPPRFAIEKTFENLYDEDFMRFVAQYKFTIAIENSICDDYITEKLWRPIIAGSIPIYLGSPSIQDWLPNNNSAILIKDFKNIADLVAYIKQVNSDDNLYTSYMQHKLGDENNKITNQYLKYNLEKGHYGIENNEDFPIPAFECFICKTIYTKEYRKPKKESVYKCEEPRSISKHKDNWWISHWHNGKCQAKTLWYLLKVLNLETFTNEMFQKKYDEFYNNNGC